MVKGVFVEMKVEEFLQHHGVKGMKWGVRRFQPYEKGPGKPKGKFIKKVKNSRLGQEVRSAKRELSTLRTKRNMDNMSTKEIKKQGQRIQKENEMKKLSKSKKEKKDYRNRGDMSTQEMDRKLDRLRAKDLLSQNADKAAKPYVDAGKRVTESVMSLTASYVTSGGNVTRDQVYDAVFSPKATTAKSVMNTVLDRKK